MGGAEETSLSSRPHEVTENSLQSGGHPPYASEGKKLTSLSRVKMCSLLKIICLWFQFIFNPFKDLEETAQELGSSSPMN